MKTELQNVAIFFAGLEGIFCPRAGLIRDRPFPQFPDQFSVKIETIVKVSRGGRSAVPRYQQKLQITVCGSQISITVLYY